MAASLNRLAFFYHVQGRYAEAEPLYQRSLAILEKALGPDHPRVTLSRSNLAHFYHIQGKYRPAEPLLKQVLKIQEKILGGKHPALAEVLETYAVLLRETGRAAEAAEIEDRAKAIRSK